MKVRLRKSSSAALIAAVAILASACNQKPATPANRGRVVYMTNCIVCHNPDPNLDGSQGPAIAGSSFELVQDRVLFLKYPPGYTAKRKTHAMRALPFLKPEIGNITAFLQEAAKQSGAAQASPH